MVTSEFKTVVDFVLQQFPDVHQPVQTPAYSQTDVTSQIGLLCRGTRRETGAYKMEEIWRRLQTSPASTSLHGLVQMFDTG